MASPVYLASMIVMGVLALLVIALTATGRDWVDYSPRIGTPKPATLSRLARSPLVWAILFFGVVVLALAASLWAVTGGSTSVVLAIVALLVIGLLVTGVYARGRSRGHPHAYAVGEAVITIGFLVLVALAGYLLTSFGA